MSIYTAVKIAFYENRICEYNATSDRAASKIATV